MMNLRLLIRIFLSTVHWRQADLSHHGSESRSLCCPEHYQLDPSESNKCYRVHNESESWMDAERKCNNVFGGHLASFQTQEQLNFLYSFLSQNSLWIGANDIDEEGQWVFSDGTSYPSSPVDQVIEHKEYVDHCAELRPIPYHRVADGNCSSQLFYICMAEALPGMQQGNLNLICYQSPVYEVRQEGHLSLKSQDDEIVFGHLIDTNIDSCVENREVVERMFFPMVEILVKHNQGQWNDGDSAVLNVLFNDTITCQERQVLNTPAKGKCLKMNRCALLTTSPSTMCSYNCPCPPPQCTVKLVDTYYGYHRQPTAICEVVFGTKM